jgi:vitamin B12 transporter
MSNFYRLHPRASARALTAVSFVSLVSVSAGALAETTIEPVVVTAARIEQKQTDALPFTTVISAEDIRNSQAVDLPSLLQREAGIQFTQNGGLGQSSGLFVRGAETRQTLILLDGVPLTKQDASGTVSIEHLMLDQIDHIEIVRGNVSSIYGSSAIGGVVQIFTRRGNGPAKVTLQTEAGSRGSTRVAAGVTGGSSDGGNDTVHYSLNVSNYRTNGFSALNPTQVPTANPDRDGYRNSSVSGALSRDFGEDNQIGVNFSATEGRFDFDSSFGVPADVHTGKTEVNTMAVYSQNRISQSWSSRVTYSQARDKNANRYDTSNGIIDDRYRSRTRMLQWTNEFTLTPDWHATAGVERQWQDLAADDGYGGLVAVNRNANSVFAGVDGKIGFHQLQFNVRQDRIDSLEGATTGYLGYGYALSTRWKALASVATGFAAPPLGYLYSPGFGNPDLKPERSRSAELGLQYSYGGALVRAALFDTRTRQQLEYDQVANVFSNIGRVTNRGLELSASGTIAETALRASLTLQDPRNDETGARLIRRARTMASVGASRSFGAWRIGGDVAFTASRPDVSSQLGAYELINLNARYKLTKTVELFARVDNLLNRDYQTAYGYNQPPRGVFAGLRWQQ